LNLNLRNIEGKQETCTLSPQPPIDDLPAVQVGL
jgi:hypothetical protein